MPQSLAVEATAGSLGTDEGRGAAKSEGSEAEVARELWKELVNVRAVLKRAHKLCETPQAAGGSGKCYSAKCDCPGKFKRSECTVEGSLLKGHKRGCMNAKDTCEVLSTL